MIIKTPKFWLKKGFLSYILLPLSLLYCSIVWIRNLFIRQHKIKKPIICIGNLTMGGSGKTPVALALGKILQELNIEFAYLSRGYKSSNKKFTLINLKDPAKKTGDEPRLLAEIAPTFICKSRYKAAKEIEKMSHFEAIILDDAMQNHSVKKDLQIVVIDGKIQFGNGFLFPAGPLRETVKNGLKRADFIIIIGEIDKKLQDLLKNHKIIKAKILAKNRDNFVNQNLMAFCGLAYPQKFYDFLEKIGLIVKKTQNFVDHHDYSDQELEKLLKIAQKNNLKLVTTKKDWVKFSDKFKEKIAYLDINLEFENRDHIKKELEKLIIQE